MSKQKQEVCVAELNDSHNMVPQQSQPVEPTTDSVSANLQIESTGGKSEMLLRWTRISKVVTLKDEQRGLMRSSIAGPVSEVSARGKRETEKCILDQVSGSALPGTVTALIGPSGSGKTTLLNILSGRTKFTSGELVVNGQAVKASDGSSKRFVSNMAYVRQEDIFFDHLLVRDQLAYTAFLRLPQRWPRNRKLQEVDRIIRLLRLTKVQNSAINKLSGGERKRVNIGTELLTNPSCVLLDEPTSGLDSTNAVALVKLLKNLAQTQRKTILMSIHQPSSGMFLDFDSLSLMAEGNIVFFGSPSASLQYLRERNFPCPPGYNVADHWMDLLVSDIDTNVVDQSSESTKNLSDAENGHKETMKLRKRSSQGPDEEVPTLHSCTRKSLIEAWDGEIVAEENERAQGPTLAFAESTDGPTLYSVDWLTQYKVLVHRAMKNSRSAIFTPLNLTKSAAIGVISGLLWFQLEYTERTVFDRTSYFFFTMTYWVFDSMFGALLAFPSERQVILKERSSKSYHLSAYFVAKTTSEAPTRLTLPLLYMTISFWMAGISSQFSLYLCTTLISLLSVLAGESFGLIIGASIDRMDQAMTVMTVCALGMMLLGGFYVTDVPSFISWAKYLSPFKYSFDASRDMIFTDPVPCDGSGELQDLCNNGQLFASPEDVKKFLQIDGSLTFNVCMLIAFGLAPRYLAYFALKSKKGGER